MKKQGKKNETQTPHLRGEACYLSVKLVSW